MAFLRFTLLITLVSTLAFLSSCSSLSRSDKAIVIDDYSSMRYIKGKPDRVHKKWKAKSSYKPRNNKVATRRNADW